MGYNTTVVVLNDALHAIRDDPAFGRRLHDAVLKVRRGQQVPVAAHGANGTHGNAAVVIETHHASQDVTVIVGGNTGRLVPSQGGE